MNILIPYVEFILYNRICYYSNVNIAFYGNVNMGMKDINSERIFRLIRTNEALEHLELFNINILHLNSNVKINKI